MKKISPKAKNDIYIVLNLILAVVQMALAISLIGGTTATSLELISLFMCLTIASQFLYQVLVFFVQDTKKAKIRAIIIGSLFIVSAALAFFGRYNIYLFCYSGSLAMLTLSLNEFLHIDKTKNKAGIFSGVLLGIVLLGFAVSCLIGINEESSMIIPSFIAIVFLVIAIKRLLFPTLKFEKIKVLLDILLKTHTIDSIVGLLAFIIAFSFLFPLFEPTIPTYWDAMWYCFTVITTIGFGDFAATTLVGRILTVILGIYGIVIVAIITSVIVNYYNEVTAKDKAKDMIE